MFDFWPEWKNIAPKQQENTAIEIFSEYEKFRTGNSYAYGILAKSIIKLEQYHYGDADELE